MRTRLILAGPVVAMNLLLGADSAGAQESQPPPERTEEKAQVDRGRGGATVVHAVEVGTGRTTTSNSRTRSFGQRSRVSTPQPDVFYADIPWVVPGADGRLCIEVERHPVSSIETVAALEESYDLRWIRLVRNFDLCPRATAPPRSRAATAAQYWRQVGEDLLPKPEPRIAPGFMLAGKLGYLEVGSPPTTRFEHATPLGLLTLEATSQVWVDWGDGSGLTGPYEGPGAPWPNGRITHSWTDARLYDVRVVQRWVARWQLGGASGELRDLATEGVLEDFEVRQLQAVRNL